MRVYVLHFDGPSSLGRAFDVVLESPDASSCMIEPQQERIRFLAHKVAANALVERIYEDGGLVWCSRYDTFEAPLEEVGDAQAKPPRGLHPPNA
jgi:hypothetical protein